MNKILIGKNIKEIRLSAKLTQKQFGEKLGFSARTISDWECENTEPDLYTIKEICKKFNVTYEDILD